MRKKNLWLGAFSHAQKCHFYQFSFAKIISVNLFQVRQWVTQCVTFALMVISPRVAPPPSRASLTRTAQNWASRHWDGARPLQTASVALRTRRQRWSALIITLCARLVRTYALSCHGQIIWNVLGLILESGLIISTVFIQHTHIHNTHMHQCCWLNLSCQQLKNQLEVNYFKHVVIFTPKGRGFPRSGSLSRFQSFANSCVP